MNNSWKKALSVGALSTIAFSTYGFAGELPGEGVTVQPVQSTVAEETFQTLIVNRALEALGYDVQPKKWITTSVTPR